MKHCYNCHSKFPDTFLFCTGCGASFDVKYCHKLHANSSHAEYCHVCGSSELSSPHKRPTESMRSVIVLTIIVLFAAAGILRMVLRSFPETGLMQPRTVLATASASACFVAICSWVRRKR